MRSSFVRPPPTRRRCRSRMRRGTTRRRPRRSGRLCRGRGQVGRCAWSRRAGRRLRATCGRADRSSMRRLGSRLRLRGRWRSVFFAFRSSSFSPPIATTSSLTPVTSANAAISASTASAPAPGFAKITIPNTIDTRPVRIIDAVPGPSSGSRNDAPTARIPSPTAYAPITYRSASAEISGPGEDQHADGDPEEAPEDQPRRAPPSPAR